MSEIAMLKYGWVKKQMGWKRYDGGVFRHWT